MANLTSARKRLTDLVDGLRTFEDPEKNVVLTRTGQKRNMTPASGEGF